MGRSAQRDLSPGDPPRSLAVVGIGDALAKVGRNGPAAHPEDFAAQGFPLGEGDARAGHGLYLFFCEPFSQPPAVWFPSTTA